MLLATIKNTDNTWLDEHKITTLGVWHCVVRKIFHSILEEHAVSAALKIVAAYSSEMPENIYQTNCHDFLEEGNVNGHCHENLKSNMQQYYRP